MPPRLALPSSPSSTTDTITVDPAPYIKAVQHMDSDPENGLAYPECTDAVVFVEEQSGNGQWEVVVIGLNGEKVNEVKSFLILGVIKKDGTRLTCRGKTGDSILVSTCLSLRTKTKTTHLSFRSSTPASPPKAPSPSACTTGSLPSSSASSATRSTKASGSGSLRRAALRRSLRRRTRSAGSSSPPTPSPFTPSPTGR